jgi:RHS repeat-associated protein
LLYLTIDGVPYIPCYDNIGNITRYLDANGNTVAQYTYDAFGGTLLQSGSLASFFRHRFSTKYLDIETCLYYYGYRFYLPVLMRWLGRDLIEDVNLYAFLSNNGLVSFDLLGKSNGKKDGEWINLRNRQESHVWNCVEWKSVTDKKPGGTKDKFIQHFESKAFKGMGVTDAAATAFAYGIVNNIGMDLDAKACWCLTMKMSVYTRMVNGKTQFKLKFTVTNLDKHPTCCPRPEIHQTNVEGKTFEIGPY